MSAANWAEPGLRIADDLTLPASAVTATFVVVGIRGSGKTNTGTVLVEEMAEVARFVVIDPTSSWYGLRSAADGKGPGLPVVVLGGPHGDAPIEESAGQLIADFVISSPYSIVLDLSLLRKGQQVRFVAEFLEALYHGNREPLHVVIDEVQRFAPQQQREKGGYLPRCIGAVEDIVKLGRNKGLGATLISQRLSSINTDAREQAQTLIAHNTVGVLDRKAVAAWFDAQGDPTSVGEALATLPKLGVGIAYVMSPAYLRYFGQVKVRSRRTYDSSKTPEVGQRRTEPVGRAEIDLSELRKRLGALIEKAKAEDPKALRQRVVELERELKARPTEQWTAKLQPTVVERVEVPVLTEAMAERVDDVIQSLQAFLGGLDGAITSVSEMVSTLVGALAQATNLPPAVRTPTTSPSRAATSPSRTAATPSSGLSALSDASLGTPERKVLTALVQHGPQDRTRLGLLAGYRPDTGHFGNVLSALRSKAFIDGRNPLEVTAAGQVALGPVEPLPAPGPELVAYWKGRVGGPAARVLQALVDVYPNAMTRQALAEATEYRADTGHFGNILSELRGLRVIEGARELRASDALF